MHQLVQNLQALGSAAEDIRRGKTPLSSSIDACTKGHAIFSALNQFSDSKQSKANCLAFFKTVNHFKSLKPAEVEGDAFVTCFIDAAKRHKTFMYAEVMIMLKAKGLKATADAAMEEPLQRAEAIAAGGKEGHSWKASKGNMALKDALDVGSDTMFVMF